MEQEFSLLHLPILVIQNCLKFLDVYEFIDFSLISKRTKRLASTVRRQQIGINIQFQSRSLIYLTLPKYPDKEWLILFLDDVDERPIKHLRKINGKSVLSAIEEGPGQTLYFYRLIFSGGNNEENTKWMVEHLNVVFSSPIKCVSLDMSVEIGALNWLQKFQPSIEFFSGKGEVRSNDDVSFILSNLQIKKELSFIAKLTDFHFNKAINVHSLFLEHANWITMDAILASENTQISICDSCFTPNDLNKFLKKWIGGWNKNLEYFEAVTVVEDDKKKTENFEEITKDIEFREYNAEDNPERPKELEFWSGYFMDIIVENNFQLSRSDGKTAAFRHFYKQDEEEDELNERFVFHAWDRLTN
ncbi:unnamed protein product [Caenorhabditis brenneri]